MTEEPDGLDAAAVRQAEEALSPGLHTLGPKNAVKARLLALMATYKPAAEEAWVNLQEEKGEEAVRTTPALPTGGEEG